jgi:hypothetical protein
MKEEEIIDSVVAQKDRISIDVSDIREEIETCRTDAAWKELPLSAKIRVLIKERLEQIKTLKSSLAPHHEPDATVLLKRMAAGKRPEDGELLEVAQKTGIREEELIQLRSRLFPKG